MLKWHGWWGWAAGNVGAEKRSSRERAEFQCLGFTLDSGQIPFPLQDCFSICEMGAGSLHDLLSGEDLTGACLWRAGPGLVQ